MDTVHVLLFSSLLASLFVFSFDTLNFALCTFQGQDYNLSAFSGLTMLIPRAFELQTYNSVKVHLNFKRQFLYKSS